MRIEKLVATLVILIKPLTVQPSGPFARVEVLKAFEFGLLACVQRAVTALLQVLEQQ
jgi:hypothetical protein